MVKGILTFKLRLMVLVMEIILNLMEMGYTENIIVNFKYY